MTLPEYKVICLTGGPCGGKTSSVSLLTDYFESFGWRVYRVPEAATLLFSGGVSFPDLDADSAYSFQKSILTVMLEIENAYRELGRLNAKRGIKSVLICDRGAMDPSAYMPRNEWLQMLKEMNLEETALRDYRYDCVIHLVTAAKGATEFYTTENNSTRTEGVELAKKLDAAVMGAWVGHQALVVIDNESVANFREKCDRVIQTVSTRFGIANPPGRFTGKVTKKKFLVKNFDPQAQFPVYSRTFMVEHYYLVNTSGDGSQTRIRKRQEIGESATVHFTMTARTTVNGQRLETRRNLQHREFESYRLQADPSRQKIVKIRRCFLFNDRYFQLDLFTSPHKGLVLLEAYLGEDYDHMAHGAIPEWLDVVDVTDDKAYSMFNLSLSS
ncbi:AAA domain-containing protein [Gorgonomyces haynaldii]|nr:AAA domain-containing protein [Gorgonomyces haynaldii]